MSIKKIIQDCIFKVVSFIFAFHSFQNIADIAVSFIVDIYVVMKLMFVYISHFSFKPALTKHKAIILPMVEELLHYQTMQ